MNAGARPVSMYLLFACLVFQGLSGLVGGFGLVGDPSGAALRIPIGWLDGSPFENYLIPGLVLFLALGVVPLAVVYGLWTRRRLAWHAALLVGVALLVWLGVEIVVIGYQAEPPFQLIYGSVGAAIVALSMLPSLREHFSPRRR